MLLSVYIAAKPSAGITHDGQVALEDICLEVSAVALSMAFAVDAARFLKAPYAHCHVTPDRA